MPNLLERVESILIKRPDLNPLLKNLAQRIVKDEEIIECSRESLSCNRTAIFIANNTKDNKSKVYHTAARFACRMPEVPVLIGDMPPIGDWHDGYDSERSELAHMLPNKIFPVKLPSKQYHTYTEALGLIEAAVIAEKRTNLIIISHPLHQIRAFVTTVSVLQNEYRPLESSTHIFNLSCSDCSDIEWESDVRHSQGQGGKTRMEWLEIELSKVIESVISEESKAVEQTKTNPQTINYLVGKVMQKTKGKADPKLTLDLLKKKL